MFIRLLSLCLSLCMLFMLPACKARPIEAKTRQTLSPAESAKSVQQRRSVSAFNRVLINGLFDVGIHTGYAKPEILLKGSSADLAKVNVSVTDGILLIRSIPTMGKVFVEIRTKNLNAFNYKGSGIIKGPRLNTNALDLRIKNPEKTELAGNIRLRNLEVEGPGNVQIAGIKSSFLQVKLRGNPNVQLAGEAKLNDLDINGDARFCLYWVSSDYLRIRSVGKSSLQLAGLVNKLDMELGGQGHFDGRYLRVSRTFVKTYGQALAEINSVDRQHTLASDASDIRFYNLPTIRNDFMAFNGAVLDMRDWNLPDLEEYTRYNKDIALGDW